VGKIALVTDSTADLNTDLTQQYNIVVVPLNVHFQDDVFKDTIDLDTDAFFKKLEESSVPPRTSQPSPGDFHKVYKALLREGYQSIVSVHISKELSGTWQSACIARDMLPEEDIHIVDSKSASMGIGIIVLNIAQKLSQFESALAAARYGQDLVEQQRVLFGVDTLEYLHRNGRIGKAAKLVGGLLNVKPILHLDGQGFVAPLAKIRGQSKFIPFLVEQAEKFAQEQELDAVVVHARAPEKAAELAARVKAQLNIRNFYQSEIGSVIGTHAGPGALGLILQKP